MKSIGLCVLISASLLLIFPVSVLQVAPPPSSRSWDEIKLIVKKNVGISYIDDGLDYDKIKQDLIEASSKTSDPYGESWIRLRGYFLLWFADQMELREFVEKQKYEQATKGLRLQKVR